MKIPTKVKIAGITYKIKHIKMSDFDGKCLIDPQEIIFDILPKAGKEYRELIFLHEITHLLFYYSGLGNSTLWKKEHEVHKFSVLLHQFLKDNNII
jgi:hypothetical protein